MRGSGQHAPKLLRNQEQETSPDGLVTTNYTYPQLDFPHFRWARALVRHPAGALACDEMRCVPPAHMGAALARDADLSQPPWRLDQASETDAANSRRLASPNNS